MDRPKRKRGATRPPAAQSAGYSGSGVTTHVTEEVVRAVGLRERIVDIKVCAIDAVWSGLRFARRRSPR